MSMHPPSNLEWSPWRWDEEYQQYFREFVDANGETHVQWEYEVAQPPLAQDPSTPRETDDVPDVSALTLQDPASPGEEDPVHYVTSKPRSKHRSSKSKSSKSKKPSHRRSRPSHAQEEPEEVEEQEPPPAGQVYFDHATGQYLPYPGNDQGGQYSIGEDEDLQAAYHESQRYSRDQYSAGGPSSSAYGAYELAEAEETPTPSTEDRITGTAGDREVLDPRYEVKHSAYFQPGEIFKVLWPEPAGSMKAGPSVAAYPDNYGGHIFAHFRRFIVIANDYGHCQCVPISTYGKKGCTKSGAKPSQHGIVYDVNSRPHLLTGEPDLAFEPIRVHITDASEKISRESRVNYAKLTTVEHNVKVFFIGRVVTEDLPIAREAVDTCWLNKVHHSQRKRRGGQ